MNMELWRGVGKHFYLWSKEIHEEKMSLQVLIYKSAKFKDAAVIVQQQGPTSLRTETCHRD